MTWISQNFAQVVEDDDSITRQEKIESDGCAMKITSITVWRNARGTADYVWRKLTSVDLGTLYYPDLQDVNTLKTPDESAVSKLTFRTKERKPVVQYTSAGHQPGLEKSRQRMEQYRRTGNLKLDEDLVNDGFADSFVLYFERAKADRLREAFTHAIKLCGGEPPPAEPF